MIDWQPIETAPKDGTHLLCYFLGEGVTEAWWFVATREDGSEYGFEWRSICLPDHGCGCCASRNNDPIGWVPLPTPPNGIGNDSAERVAAEAKTIERVRGVMRLMTTPCLSDYPTTEKEKGWLECVDVYTDKLTKALKE